MHNSDTTPQIREQVEAVEGKTYPDPAHQQITPSRFQFISRTALAAVVAFAGCSSSDSSRDVSKPSASVNNMKGLNPMSASIASWIGRTLLDKLINEATYQEKKNEIKTDLELFEAALSRTDEQLASKIHSLRSELDAKASVEDVRQIISEVVTDLESRAVKIESGITNSEQRVKELETVFGYVPTVTPSPLLRVNREGKPEAHPLTVKWAKLLSASETHRIKMEELNHIYKANAPEMQMAITVFKKLQKETADLEKEVKTELAKLLVERMKLLETRKVNHPDIKNFDASIASLTWLTYMARPEAEGRYQGTLTVPKDLVGPAASDIVAAFDLSGEKTADLVPLYRKLIPHMPSTRTQGPGMPEEIQEFAQEYYALLEKLKELHKEAAVVDMELRTLLQTHSHLHPKVATLNQRKTGLLSRVRQENTYITGFLHTSVQRYIELLKHYRPTHPQM